MIRYLLLIPLESGCWSRAEVAQPGQSNSLVRSRPRVQIPSSASQNSKAKSVESYRSAADYVKDLNSELSRWPSLQVRMRRIPLFEPSSVRKSSDRISFKSRSPAKYSRRHSIHSDAIIICSRGCKHLTPFLTRRGEIAS